MIDQLCLTIIVQGPIFLREINGGTERVLASLRKVFPLSKLILSTYQSEKEKITIDFLYDKIIYSDDPGDFTPSPAKPLNINRQLLTTQAGLQCVQTKFVLKTRTDLVFASDGILKFFNDEDDDEQILVADITTRDPDLAVRVPYWLCDFFLLGRTDALRFVFSAPPFSNQDFQYFDSTRSPSKYCKDVVSKFPPEVYLGLRIREYFDRNASVVADTKIAEEMDLIEFWGFISRRIIITSALQAAVTSIKYQLPFPNSQVMISPLKYRIIKRVNNVLAIRMIRRIHQFLYIIERICCLTAEYVISLFVKNKS